MKTSITAPTENQTKDLTVFQMNIFLTELSTSVNPAKPPLRFGRKLGVQQTYSRSFPPVTISPSRSVVNIVKTGPLWALVTTRLRFESCHTYTSPFSAPVKVALFCINQDKQN